MQGHVFMRCAGFLCALLISQVAFSADCSFKCVSNGLSASLTIDNQTPYPMHLGFISASHGTTPSWPRTIPANSRITKYACIKEATVRIPLPIVKCKQFATPPKGYVKYYMNYADGRIDLTMNYNLDPGQTQAYMSGGGEGLPKKWSSIITITPNSTQCNAHCFGGQIITYTITKSR